MPPANPCFGMPPALWTQRRETALNWLALGLLLAAWNAVDDPGAADASHPVDASHAADASHPVDASRPADARREADHRADAPGSAVALGASARRPATLRGVPCVTVRSMTRNVAVDR